MCQFYQALREKVKNQPSNNKEAVQGAKLYSAKHGVPEKDTCEAL
jgi:hypothetical protein